MTNLVVLNGPPGIGKDTLADEIAKEQYWTKFEQKQIFN